MNRALRSVAAVAALAASMPLAAQSNTNPAAVQAGTYAVESTHTLVQFTVNHFGISDFFGTFPGATGTLTLDPKDIAAARLDVNVPVATVSTSNKVLDGELASADWLDAAQFPTMHFVSTKVVKTGAGTATIAGMLTLHGVTRPVTLKATFAAAAMNPMRKAYSLGFKATGTIRRADFGVAKYVPMVSDETTITISAAFEKQG